VARDEAGAVSSSDGFALDRGESAQALDQLLVQLAVAGQLGGVVLSLGESRVVPQLYAVVGGLVYQPFVAQIVGIGGHQGKQMDFVAHFGLGDAARAERVEIEWPAPERVVTVLENVEAGSRLISLGEHPLPVDD
jgi:hypothetical protein